PADGGQDARGRGGDQTADQMIRAVSRMNLGQAVRPQITSDHLVKSILNCPCNASRSASPAASQNRYRPRTVSNSPIASWRPRLLHNTEAHQCRLTTLPLPGRSPLYT